MFVLNGYRASEATANRRGLWSAPVPKGRDERAYTDIMQASGNVSCVPQGSCFLGAKVLEPFYSAVPPPARSGLEQDVGVHTSRLVFEVMVVFVFGGDWWCHGT